MAAGRSQLLWERKDIGKGYSTPAVVGDALYLMVNRDKKEYVLALAVKDGAQVWETEVGKLVPMVLNIPATSLDTDSGRATQIYVLGSDGDVACLQKDNGKIVWSKNLKKDYSRRSGRGPTPSRFCSTATN